MADEWITVREAISQSGYNPVHLRVLIRDSKIKGRKVATVWLVNRKSLDAYLREQSKRGEKRGRKPNT
jgi:hypothetical protein